MALTPEDISALSRLLDEALVLPAADHEAWLARLPLPQKVHVPRLRGMLARYSQDTQTTQTTRTPGAPLGVAAARSSDSGRGAGLRQLPPLGAGEPVAEPGDRVGPYRLLREIGHGGMGSVWLADRADGAFQRQVALKLQRVSGSAGLAERMAREREIGALLEHPHIARLYDAGLDERGRPFIAMEYVDGLALGLYCRARLPRPWH